MIRTRLYDRENDVLSVDDPKDAAIIVARCLADTYADDAQHYRDGLAEGLTRPGQPIGQRVGRWLTFAMMYYHQSRLSGHQPAYPLDTYVRALLTTMGHLPEEIPLAIRSALETASSLEWLPVGTRREVERLEESVQ